ncbi:DEAD/DEAH box helicase [Saliterribacillus persicus]|uniref:Helicase-like protein n=1 Tax=Saliterribacillus persicus TaxID=930114 RepID=A0A368XCG0_9BACI|nr:SNF2-related protein [Saliterribacillus persicus]RCW65389.1 helicase-like protein [Saliterribacillus persicus]
MDVSIKWDEEFFICLEQNLKQNINLASWDEFNMAYETVKSKQIRDFDELMTLDYLPHVKFLPHQIHSAKKVLTMMNGRALLADEVGLGKTIEAGLILKEYMLRGNIKKALILVPASLINQWVNELNQKFYIPAVASRKKMDWEMQEIVVTSLETAKRETNQKIILEQKYDLVIVDEAHKLRNKKTKNFNFVQALQKKYCLLLTATPMHNQIEDIFNLINLLKPGYLGDYNSFSQRFADGESSKHYVRQLIENVMIRNRRTDTEMNPSKRHIETIWVNPSNEEKEYYQLLESKLPSNSPFGNIIYKREFCSSIEACYVSLQKLLAKEEDLSKKEVISKLIEDITKIPKFTKAKKLAELLSNKKEKFIIFTEYHATQQALLALLIQNGIKAVPFRGGFKKSKKDYMKHLFEHYADVLVATEAAGEGINLQFCNHLINYDLPWNPMKLEQRIGRIHRFGQDKDVYIYNFALKETLEEDIVHLLYKKLHLFENVIGGLDKILEQLNMKDLEHMLNHIYSTSKTTGEAKIKIENISTILDSFTQERMPHSNAN